MVLIIIILIHSPSSTHSDIMYHHLQVARGKVLILPSVDKRQGLWDGFIVIAAPRDSVFPSVQTFAAFRKKSNEKANEKCPVLYSHQHSTQDMSGISLWIKRKWSFRTILQIISTDWVFNEVLHNTFLRSLWIWSNSPKARPSEEVLADWRILSLRSMVDLSLDFEEFILNHTQCQAWEKCTLSNSSSILLYKRSCMEVCSAQALAMMLRH